MLRIRNIVNFKSKMMIFDGSVCYVILVRMQNSSPVGLESNLEMLCSYHT